MSREREPKFTAEYWLKIRDYLEKHRVGGQRLVVRQPNAVVYDRKVPDIVVTDEIDIPQLIIETKRKSDRGEESILDPLNPATVAQALCYAALAMDARNMDRTPMFVTANRDKAVVFKGIERSKVSDLVDLCSCRESHNSPDDWAKALKPRAYIILLRDYLVTDRLRNPLSEDSIKKLFEYLEKWIVQESIRPPELYRVLVDRFKEYIDKLHNAYVEDAVKAKILEDQNYFEELYKLAQRQGYGNGILSPGLFSLCPFEDRTTREKICKPLAEYIVMKLSEANNPREQFFTLRSLADMTIRQLVSYCKEANGEAPAICEKSVREVISFRNLSRMMTYVLAAKILAYKVLELHYDIHPLQPLADTITVDGERVEVRGPDDIIKVLDKIFATASRRLEELIRVKDFKPIFETGLYDKIVLKGYDSINVINELIRITETIKESLIQLPGIMGYVYEGFIPPAERHQLGQFYTPPAVARLIANWSIRSGDDRVLDGGCGSGTFLIEAYKRLLFLKYNKVYGESYPSCHNGVNEHQEILDRLYGVDINAFAAQMTALHLMLMEPKCPFARLNLAYRDFFSLTANDLEATGLFDAVIGNPPYTRWVEIPDETKRLIADRVRDFMQSYDLTPDLQRGREPGIYTHWILHATKNLLKDGGRLGMIISNMWLQTDYGIGFGNFLLDNFKIKALLDISYRLFDAIISTVIVLAEKEQNKALRDSNELLLVRIPPIDSSLSDKEVEKKLDEVLTDIENTISRNSLNYEFDKSTLERCSKQHGIWYSFVKQQELPRDRKWVSLFFQGVEDVVNMLEQHPLMIKIGEWFKPSYGNALYLCTSSWNVVGGVRNLGSKVFFYFSKDKVEEWERKVKGFSNYITAYLTPAITASRYIKTFTFTESDWRQLEHGGQNAYILLLHEEKDKLPKQLKTYVRWGETECKTKIRGTRGGGRICSEAEACRAREEARKRALEEGRKPLFYGWYDLGGYIPTPFMAIRQARYHPQFFLATKNVVTYDAIITFIPRVRVRLGGQIFDPIKYNEAFDNIIDETKADVELDEAEVKAIMAYLNSTFNWLWLEQNARYIAKGPLGLEVSTVERMPCLDVKRIDRSHVKKLAELFDKLESEARQLISRNNSSLKDQEAEEEGGKKFEMFKKLESVFKEIDAKVVEILGITTNQDMLWNYAWEMMERRIKGAGRRVKPGAEIEIGVRIESTKRKKKRVPSRDITVPLTKWIEGYGDEEDKLRSNSIS
jgi:type I restriction-modification system DNA methylase subunit